MLRKVLKLLALPLALGTALHAGSALAFFDAEALIGKRWYQLDTKPEKTGFSSQEIDLAAHIDPIPLVPVSFGLKLGIGTLNQDDLKASGFDSVDTAQVIEPGIDIMAWIPMVPVVTPYIRLDIPVAATAVLKGKIGGDSYSEKADLSGYQIGLGIKYSPIPLVRVMAELQRGAEKWKETEIKRAGVKASNDSYDLNSNAFLVGVEIGI